MRAAKCRGVTPLASAALTSQRARTNNYFTKVTTAVMNRKQIATDLKASGVGIIMHGQHGFVNRSTPVHIALTAHTKKTDTPNINITDKKKVARTAG